MYKKCEEILNKLESEGKIKISDYQFPQKQELKLKLKDMLEDEVDEKYYLSDKQLNYVLDMKDVALKSGRNINDRIVNPQIAKTISCRGAVDQRADVTNFTIDECDEELKVKDIKEMSLLIKNNTKKGYLEAVEGDGVDVSGRMQWHRGTVQKQMIQTLDSQGGNSKGVVIKKDTPSNELIEQGMVEENDVIRHSYSNSRMNNFYKQNSANNNVSPTLDTRCDCLGVTVKTIGNYSPSNHNASRVVDNDGLAPTVMENHGTVTATNVSNLRIRKLTPKECWRLMGFDDEDFEKAEKVNSNTQLYKQSGNSIVVNVLEAILNNLLNQK